MAEPLLGDSLKWLLIGMLGLLAIFVLIQIFYRYLHLLAKKIKMAMLGREPRNTRDLAKKYAHAHDPLIIRKRALEDKLLPKYGSKKTELAITKLINKRRNGTSKK